MEVHAASLMMRDSDSTLQCGSEHTDNNFLIVAIGFAVTAPAIGATVGSATEHVARARSGGVGRGGLNRDRLHYARGQHQPGWQESLRRQTCRLASRLLFARAQAYSEPLTRGAVSRPFYYRSCKRARRRMPWLGKRLATLQAGGVVASSPRWGTGTGAISPAGFTGRPG